MFIGETCYNFKTFGKCSRGLACRFGSAHISPEGRNTIDLEKINDEITTKNQLKHELQVSLRKRTYDFNFSESLIKYNDRRNKKVKKNNNNFINSVLILRKPKTQNQNQTVAQ